MELTSKTDYVISVMRAIVDGKSKEEITQLIINSRKEIDKALNLAFKQRAIVQSLVDFSEVEEDNKKIECIYNQLYKS